jgi:hypothetical protein
MHTLHWWAVEAEDKEDAFYQVTNRLINDEGGHFVEWSDWHVVGGGRWSDSQYEDSKDMIVSYKDEPELFMQRLQMCKDNRIGEMNTYLNKINLDRFTSDMVDYISNSGIPNDEERFNMNSWYIRKAGELLTDNYSSDSYFYDMVEYTAHMGYIQERLDKEPGGLIQFLVPIDFHF